MMKNLERELSLLPGRKASLSPEMKTQNKMDQILIKLAVLYFPLQVIQFTKVVHRSL